MGGTSFLGSGMVIRGALSTERGRLERYHGWLGARMQPRVDPSLVAGRMGRGPVVTRVATTATLVWCIVLVACGSRSSEGPKWAGGPASRDRVVFASSVASDHGGQPTPVAVADMFAAQDAGTFALPKVGWRTVSRTDGGVTLGPGSVFLHATRGPDGMWQVDSGSRCG